MITPGTIKSRKPPKSIRPNKSENPKVDRKRSPPEKSVEMEVAFPRSKSSIKRRYPIPRKIDITLLIMLNTVVTRVEAGVASPFCRKAAPAIPPTNESPNDNAKMIKVAPTSRPKFAFQVFQAYVKISPTSGTTFLIGVFDGVVE
jgi:hypothetical protein